jgi:U3 small nucleolar ribonucleoprotein protein IMP4
MSTSTSTHRRGARLRREYLYTKSLEAKDAASFESKRLLKAALAAGKAVPTELRAEYDKLKAGVDAEDAKTEAGANALDDEYAGAGLADPRVCVTTSREPSSRLKQFAKEVNLIVPNATRVNRGGYRVDELVATCREADFTDMIVVQETRGEPDGLVISHLPHGPTAFFSLSNTVLRHDIAGVGSMSEAYPHVILPGFESKLGRRLGNVLKCLFPVPKPDTKRLMTFSNDDDFISFRHHMFARQGPEKVALSEVGPRFEMRLYQLRLGTLDNKDAENEYVLRPYQNTSKKRKTL